MTAKGTLHAVRPRAAGTDVHRMQVTATVRTARKDAGAEVRTRGSGALPGGPATLAGRRRDRGVTAAATEGAGVCRETACDTVAEAGAPAAARAARPGS